MKIPHLGEIVIAAVIALALVTAGWYLVRHPEIATLDERQSGRGQ